MREGSHHFKRSCSELTGAERRLMEVMSADPDLDRAAVTLGVGRKTLMKRLQTIREKFNIRSDGGLIEAFRATQDQKEASPC
jgi:hypothetical protein